MNDEPDPRGIPLEITRYDAGGMTVNLKPLGHLASGESFVMTYECDEYDGDIIAVYGKKQAVYDDLKPP
jgi:hypothetical protein